MIRWDLEEPTFYVYVSDEINSYVILNQSDFDNPMPINATFSRSFS